MEIDNEPMFSGEAPEPSKTPWKGIFIFFLGFMSYPLLFVPLAQIFAPGFMMWWIYTYAEYLRWWGF